MYNIVQNIHIITTPFMAAITNVMAAIFLFR